MRSRRHGLIALLVLAALPAANGCRSERGGRVERADTASLVPDLAPSVATTQPAVLPPSATLPTANPAAEGLSETPAKPTLADLRTVAGRTCRVHLRRDAMGLTGMSPLGLQAGSPAARLVQLDGIMEQTSDRWVVLRAADRKYWIPTDVVLAIEFADDR